jgi:transcriptional regulator EpsA
MRAITFLRTLGPEELLRYHQVVSHSELVRSHLDVLVWLQGDMQQFLPHEIMIAAWGDFSTGAVQHDIISAISGVRSNASNAVTLTPLLVSLFQRWAGLGKVPLAINAGDTGFLLEDSGLQCALGSALQTMRSAVVHCICDERGSHDCLYVTFSTQERADASMRGAMAVVLPFIDLALRQITHLPHQLAQTPAAPDEAVIKQLVEAHDLSERELQILHWVAQGKTNPEIGSILNISAFTVKNHMQRMFKKLNVSNRAQAVAKFNAIVSNA